MDYFSILNLDKEPFSNSPDPEYFFQSRQHFGCLQKIELSLRLRRGLNVVIGDVGAGKTTLCRQLIRRFAGDAEYETYLILDPSFSSTSELLNTIAEMFEGEKTPDDADEFQVKEVIKRHIFRKGVDEKKTVILIIDEGQKIPEFCLEVLREFLNYETNEYKLLQIVIFAQREFENTLKTHHNFADRINLYHFLGPLGFKDTRMMIQFRVRQSSKAGGDLALFSYAALWAIYRATEGYPRKIINLCHQCMLALIIQNRRTISWFLVRSCVRRSVYQEPGRPRRFVAVALTGILAALLTFGITSGSLEIPVNWKAFVRKMPGAQHPLPEKRIPVFKIERDIEVNQENGIQTDDESAVKALPEPVREAALSPVIEDVDERDSAAPEPLSEPEEMSSNDTSSDENMESAADESDGLPPPSFNFPSLLGRVALKQNETLWRLVEKVYGAYSGERLEFLLQENSQIMDPDHTEVGQLISVPAIPIHVKPLKAEIWWVKVGEKDTLDAAVDTLRVHPENAPPIRIIPHWNTRQGLRFAILLRAHYFDEVSAMNQLSRLMPFMAAEGTLLSHWNEDTVFFSDPYSK